MTVKLCPLGDAMTRGSRRDATGSLLTPIHPSYRYTLDQLRNQRGYDLQFVGSSTYPDFPPEQYLFDQDNEAHGGNTTLSVIASSVAEWTAGYVPDIVLLLAGREDAYAATSVSARVDALTSIVQRLREKNPKVWVMVGTVPPTLDGAAGTYRTLQQITPHNAALPAWVAGITTAASPVILVDMHTGFVQEHTIDGLELSALGDAWIAGRWIMALDAALPQWAAATGGTYVPGSGGGEPTEGPILPRLSMVPVAGSAPLEVQFIDRSIVDQWSHTWEVWILGGIPLDFVQQVMAFAPSWLKVSGYRTDLVEGVDYEMGTSYDSNYPWPKVSNKIIFWPRTNTHGWFATFGAAAGGWVDGNGQNYWGGATIPANDFQLPPNNLYADLGQTVEHEMCHTVVGLESSDEMRVSAGFLVWLRGMDPTNPFLSDPQNTPLTYENKNLYYRYLGERYRTDPTLTSGQVTFDLDFGDGSPHVQEPDCEHVYTNGGTFTPIYRVTTIGGTATRSFTDAIAVSGAGGPPVVSFSANRVSGTMPLDVQFRFTGANAVRWLWTFGDGATSTEQHPAHVYSNPDTYSVKCEAWNADGVHAEITAPAYIVVASDAAPPSVVHMVTAAGVGRLLTYIARMWSWIQVLDSSGDAVGTRIYDTEMWSQDELGQVWVDSTIPGSPLFPFLPLTVGGIEIWDAETGGNRITRIMFTDTPGTIELPEIREVKDSITMHIGVGLTGSDTVPHIVDALIAGSTVVGDMAVITFRLYGGEGGYRIDTPTITRDVPDGGTAQIRFIMNRVE